MHNDKAYDMTVKISADGERHYDYDVIDEDIVDDVIATVDESGE